MIDLLGIALGAVAGLAAGLATRKWRPRVKCAHYMPTGWAGSTYHHAQRCQSTVDARCMGGNCTKHCAELCKGKCLE